MWAGRGTGRPTQSRREVPTKNVPRTELRRPNDDQSTPLPTPRPQSARTAAPPQPSERPGFEEYNRVVNTAFEVGEHALIRDMIFVLQGIDGKYVKYSRRADGFVVDAVRTPPKILLSLTTK